MNIYDLKGSKAVSAGGVRRRIGPAALLLTSAVVLGGCSSLPDYANPVEWYRSTADAVGGMFSDEEAEAAEPSPSSGGSSGDTGAFPSLSSVPPKPTDTTPKAERDNLRQGLSADRDAAKYEDDTRTTRQVTAPSASPATPVITAAAPARSDAQSRLPSRTLNGRSALWPNAPAPSSSADAATTSGRVPDANDGAIPRVTGETPKFGSAIPSRTTAPAPATTPAPAATQSSVAAVPAPAPAPMPAPSPMATPTLALPTPSAPPVFAPAQQAAYDTIPTSPSVTIDYDQLGLAAPGFQAPSNFGLAPEGGLAAPVAGDPFRLAIGGSQPFATIAFGHGSARLSSKDMQTIKSVAEQAMNAGRFVRIVGHASSRTRDLDPVTHQVVNFDESVKRANAVAAEFRRAGFPVERLIVDAVGDTQPVYAEVMPRAEAGNRRAELFIE